MTRASAIITVIITGAMLFTYWSQSTFANEPLSGGISTNLSNSNICIKPIPGTDASVLGFALSSITEAPKANGVLIDTVGGLFYQRLDGSIVSLQPRTGQYGRDLVALPWTNDVFAAGVSETVISRDLSVTEIYHQQWSELLGVFPSIQSILLESDAVTGSNPFFGQTLTNVIEVINNVGGEYQLVMAKPNGFDHTILIIDAPWFGSPIIWENSGPFSIDPQGNVRKFAIRNFTGGILNFAEQLLSVPRFRTLYVRMSYGQRPGWFQITASRQWLPVQGLSSNTIVYSSFDPGYGDALFATSVGIVAIDPDGVAHVLADGSAPRNSIRALAQDPDGKFVLAGGDDGLYRISPNSLEVTPIPNGGAAVIGSVREIIPVKFAKLDFVVTSKETYIFQNGSLEQVVALGRSIGPDALHPPLSIISVLPNLQRVLAGRSNVVGPMIYELHRTGADGVCKLPLAIAQ